MSFLWLSSSKDDFNWLGYSELCNPSQYYSTLQKCTELDSVTVISEVTVPIENNIEIYCTNSCLQLKTRIWLIMFLKILKTYFLNSINLSYCVFYIRYLYQVYFFHFGLDRSVLFEE